MLPYPYLYYIIVLLNQENDHQHFLMNVVCSSKNVRGRCAKVGDECWCYHGKGVPANAVCGYPNDYKEYTQQNVETQKYVGNGHGLISSYNTTPHIFLNSISIMHELALDDNQPKSLKVECKLWTNGLDRFFKVSRQ